MSSMFSGCMRRSFCLAYVRDDLRELLLLDSVEQREIRRRRDPLGRRAAAIGQQSQFTQEIFGQPLNRRPVVELLAVRPGEPQPSIADAAGHLEEMAAELLPCMSRSARFPCRPEERR